MLCWKFLRRNEGLCFKWLIQKWTQNIRQCSWTDVLVTPLIAAMFVAFGNAWRSRESPKKWKGWWWRSLASKKWLGEIFLGKLWWCKLKLGWRNTINRLCKEGNIPTNSWGKARTDQTCHRLISMVPQIVTSRFGRGCKRCLLQSWHLMDAVNLGVEKWNDMLKFSS